MKSHNMRNAVMSGAWVLGIVACTATAPLLTPEQAELGGLPSPGRADQLNVSIRPVTTAGFRSSDRDEFGLDLSAYFTAFYVEFENGLSRTVWVDASQIFLEYDRDRILQALNEEDSVAYYRGGDRPRPAFIIVPKQRKLEKKEIARIRELRLRSASLPPGSRHAGVVYFKKLAHEECREVVLRLTEIRIEAEGLPKELRFPLQCPGPG